MFNLSPTRPDKMADPKRWNESWETDLKANYDTLRRRPLPTLNISARSQSFAQSLLPHTILYQEREIRDVCKLQQDLARMALERLACDDLENKWMGLKQADREAFALRGLQKASCAGPDMEGHRKYCPDMTVRNLAGGGGKNYIDLLLRKFIPEDGRITFKEPIHLPNDDVDRVLQSPFFSLISLSLKMHRAYFVTMTIWCILLAYVG